MTAADITDRVNAALYELGGSADQVADRLRALGIKGSRNDEGACPVANYLALIDEAEFGSERVQVELPGAVSWFVRRFDKGIYLDLADVAGGAR